MFAQLIRFCGVGGFATFLHLLVAITMREAAGLHPLYANFTGFLCALVVSYVGHAKFTFGASLYHGQQFLSFIIVAVMGLVISSSTVWILNIGLGLHFALSMGAVAVTVPVATYAALRLWVFDDSRLTAKPDWPGLAFAGGTALVVLALFWDRPINHDTAWYLVATRKWLGGMALYHDLIEVNPPLNFYLTLPGLGLADLFGLSDTNGAYVALALLLFAILFWSSTIIADELDLSPGQRVGLLTGIAIALVLPALNNFGQREHVMTILTLPWLLGELHAGPKPRRRQISRAFVAAIGICLKPYFVVFPLIVMLIAARRREPVITATNITFLVVGLAYVGFVALVHTAYFTQIVPVARDVYGAYGAPVDVLMAKIAFYLPSILFLTLVLFLFRARIPYCGAHLFMALSLAGGLSYFIQGTGFSYHRIPLLAYGLIACSFLLMQRAVPKAAKLAATVAAAGLMAITINNGFYRIQTIEPTLRVMEQTGPVDSLIVITSYVSAGPPAAVVGGATWASRYPANWLVPGALNRLANADCATTPDLCLRLNAIAARNRTDNLADIARFQPDLVILDKQTGYFDQPDFSWEAFMSEDPEWQTVMTGYREVERTNRYVYYRSSAARTRNN